MDQKEIHDNAVVLVGQFRAFLKTRPDLDLSNHGALVALDMAARRPEHDTAADPPQIDFATEFIKSKIYPAITDDWSEVSEIVKEIRAWGESLPE